MANDIIRQLQQEERREQIIQSNKIKQAQENLMTYKDDILIEKIEEIILKSNESLFIKIKFLIQKELKSNSYLNIKSLLVKLCLILGTLGIINHFMPGEEKTILNIILSLF